MDNLKDDAAAKEDKANGNNSSGIDGRCGHCGGLIRVRNPTGQCDHLYWPHNDCVICQKEYRRYPHPEYLRGQANPTHATISKILYEKHGHQNTEKCPEDECMICAMIDCPHGEPMHYHHDGCPACLSDTPMPTPARLKADVDRAIDAAFKANGPALMYLSLPPDQASVTIKITANREQISAKFHLLQKGLDDSGLEYKIEW